MAKSRRKRQFEGEKGAYIWRLPNGERFTLYAPTIKLPEPKPKGYYGRRARFDCCTDCGVTVNFGDLWCSNCRKNHQDPTGRDLEEGHRRKLMNDRTLVKPM